MKRRLSLFASLALLTLVVFGLAACGGSAANYAPSGAGLGSESPAESSAPGRSGEEPALIRPLAEGTAAMPESADLSYGKSGGDAIRGIVESPPTRYQSSLTAGQVDDNAKFDDYLDFLNNYQGPSVLRIPVEQRLFVRVLDGDQHPVAGARVQLFDGERAVFDGSTVSDGRVLFLPQVANATQAQQFRAVISRGQQKLETTLKAGVVDQTVAFPTINDNVGAVGIDLVFLLDATGSMGDELDQIKATVDSVAARIEQLPDSSQPRFGLVAYQDQGDNYVTKAWEFAGVSEFSRNLSNVNAEGGGDYPESVTAGLRDAINLQGWADNSTGRRLRMIILVGDAPPHLDYSNDPAYTGLLEQAVAKGIKIFPIGASGLDDQGEYIFRQFAQVTQGQFVFLTYANGTSGAPGTATNHSVSDFTVQNLDTLVVNLVAGEVANQTGKSTQSYHPKTTYMVPPIASVAPKGWLTSIMDAVRSFTDTLVSWSTVFWLLVLCMLLAWARQSPQRARLAAFLPGRQLAPEVGDDILTPGGTFDEEIYFAPKPAAKVSLHVKARSKRAGEQHTIPLRSLPPDVLARLSVR
jgi:hypothetical protein